IVTNALTHGLSLVADLFINSGDTILLPEHNWGNYKLVFNTRHNANIDTYPIFDENGHYTTKSLVKSLEAYN
ncbi:aminotransferase class I/II-fold pyridoxal phosphate-dependent enzyme, partial [Klebsiella pneumoniae]